MNKPHIKNISNFPTLIVLPMARYRRKFLPGQDIPVTQEVLEEFTYDAGCNVLVELGYLKAYPGDENEEIEVKEATGVTSEDVDIAYLLTEADVKELSEALKNGTPAFRDMVVQKAIELNIVDTPRCNLIKHFTEVDVLEAIAMSRKE